ncbi:hypothetical protein [Salarchaeum sp. JOR-1]|uniref:hypothetical protein n=1 Tax=Salarchaeum sp. JOR-1 TaxID=2599399 RepID=UPI001198C5FF|nr:hypothetical protein [Salarchaeum sp. JOR-1]QDX40276.1 hypothetical protein FQU85_04950 [Salarchaeum sp. JOR-1]
MRSDEFPDAEHYVWLHSTLRADGATYEPGDELPRELAEEAWSANSRRIAAVDSDGDRVDTPAREEGTQGGLEAMTHREIDADSALAKFRG